MSIATSGFTTADRGGSCEAHPARKRQRCPRGVAWLRPGTGFRGEGWERHTMTRFIIGAVIGLLVIVAIAEAMIVTHAWASLGEYLEQL